MNYCTDCKHCKILMQQELLERRSLWGERILARTPDGVQVMTEDMVIAALNEEKEMGQTLSNLGYYVCSHDHKTETITSPVTGATRQIRIGGLYLCTNERGICGECGPLGKRFAPDNDKLQRENNSPQG